MLFHIACFRHVWYVNFVYFFNLLLYIARPCATLSNPSNGRVTISSTSVGGTATYSCNSGYILAGSSRRTCQSGGTWSRSAPSCQCKLVLTNVISYKWQKHCQCYVVKVCQKAYEQGSGTCAVIHTITECIASIPKFRSWLVHFQLWMEDLEWKWC